MYERFAIILSRFSLYLKKHWPAVVCALQLKYLPTYHPETVVFIKLVTVVFKLQPDCLSAATCFREITWKLSKTTASYYKTNWTLSLLFTTSSIHLSNRTNNRVSCPPPPPSALSVKIDPSLNLRIDGAESRSTLDVVKFSTRYNIAVASPGTRRTSR